MEDILKKEDYKQLIEDLKDDIEEYGPNIFLRVVTRFNMKDAQRTFLSYYTEDEYFIALRDNQIRLGDNERFVMMEAWELLDYYKEYAKE